jgi:hypothetical protein
MLTGNDAYILTPNVGQHSVASWARCTRSVAYSPASMRSTSSTSCSAVSNATLPICLGYARTGSAEAVISACWRAWRSAGTPPPRPDPRTARLCPPRPEDPRRPYRLTGRRHFDRSRGHWSRLAGLEFLDRRRLSTRPPGRAPTRSPRPESACVGTDPPASAHHHPLEAAAPTCYAALTTDGFSDHLPHRPTPRGGRRRRTQSARVLRRCGTLAGPGRTGPVRERTAGVSNADPHRSSWLPPASP